MLSLFPTHPLLEPGDNNSQWWTNLTACFSRSAEEYSLKDLSEYNQVKSTALYRNTSTNIHANDNNAWSTSDIWYSASEHRG